LLKLPLNYTGTFTSFAQLPHLRLNRRILNFFKKIFGGVDFVAGFEQVNFAAVIPVRAILLFRRCVLVRNRKVSARGLFEVTGVVSFWLFYVITWYPPVLSDPTYSINLLSFRIFR